ncbi:MAG: type I glyceraldehyde-3-phosphate dehydrogenase [Patescibacteria group bacterium]|nr:type I glyceraldehyde-3-phosphate dehydrogenase [Patescibacteria group bacterium]
MNMKIAINGFGRIGRPALKIALEHPDVEISAINDLGDIDNLAYLLKYDTAYGVYQKEVAVNGNILKVDDKEIKILCEKDPLDLPWNELGIDVVLECTGVFKDRERTKGHIGAGAKKVIISAPTKDDTIKTVVIGCNENEIVSDDDILSMASCTTNCIAPIAKVLDETFGIEKALMSTIHSYTSTQALVDGPVEKDVRRGRAAAQNIVPSTTGAAIAATKTLPQLEDIFDGMAFRVPTLVGSIIDLVAVLKQKTNEKEINDAFKKAAAGQLKGIMKVTTEPLVSHDIVGSTYSCIVDAALTKVTAGNLVKVVGWYDNEWGYSNRLVDLAVIISRI